MVKPLTIWDKLKTVCDENTKLVIVAGHGGDVIIHALSDSELREKDGVNALFLDKEEAIMLLQTLIELFPDEAEEILEDL